MLGHLAFNMNVLVNFDTFVTVNDTRLSTLQTGPKSTTSYGICNGRLGEHPQPEPELFQIANKRTSTAEQFEAAKTTVKTPSSMTKSIAIVQQKYPPQTREGFDTRDRFPILIRTLTEQVE